MLEWLKKQVDAILEHVPQARIEEPPPAEDAPAEPAPEEHE